MDAPLLEGEKEGVRSLPYGLDVDTDSPSALRSAAGAPQQLADVEQTPLWLRIVNTFSYVLAATVTALATGGGIIRERSVSAVWDEHETRVTPAAYALWLWLPIHVLGAAYTLWQSGLFGRSLPKSILLRRRVDPWYAVANILTAAWMLTFIWGTTGALWFGTAIVAVVEGLLLTILIRSRSWLVIRSSWFEYLVIDCYFSLYTGWITVLLTINIATALRATGDWERVDPWTENGWACALLSLAAAINLLMLRRSGDSVFASVFCWTAASITLRAEDSDTAADKAPVSAVAISLAAVVGSVAVGEFLILAVRPCYLRSGRLGPTFVTRRGSVNTVTGQGPPSLSNLTAPSQLAKPPSV